MRLFTYKHKTSGAVLKFKASEYIHAQIELTLIVKYIGDWRCLDEKGEDIVK